VVLKRGEVGVWCNTPALIPAKAGNYVLSVWVRSTASDIVKCSLSSGCFGKENRVLPGGCKKVFKLLPNNIWQKISLPVTVPENGLKTRIDISLLSPGAIFIDDVAFEKASENPAVPGKPFLTVGKAGAPPKLDGKLDDVCWRQSIECSNFSLTAGKGVPKASTSAFVSYDDDNLYIAFKCVEKFLDPALNQMDRFKDACKRMDGAVWLDDSVEIFVKTAKDERFQLILNSLGMVFDKRLGDAKGAGGWNSGAKSAAFVGNGYWSIEVAVPLESLGLKQGEAGEIKRMNLCRTRQPIHEFSSWSPVPRGFGDDAHWGFAKFAESAPPIRCGTLRMKNAREFRLAAKLAEPIADLQMNINLGIDGKYDGRFQCETKKIGSESAVIDFKLAIPEKLENVECRYADIDYSFTLGGGIVYASPKFRYKVGKASYLIFSRLGQAIPHSREFKTLQSVSIPEGEFELLELTLSSAKFAELPERVTFFLEMPACCSLISPMHNRNSISPLSVVEKSICGGGGKLFREYKMVFPKNIVMKSDAPEWEILPIPLFIKMNGSAGFAKEDLKIKFHAFVPGIGYSEKEKIVSIEALPPFSLKRTSKKSRFIVWPWWPFYAVTQHGRYERAAILKRWRDAGFNTVATELQLNAWNMRNTLANVYGFDAMKMSPCLTAGAFLPGVADYLKKHPEQREMSFAGKPLNVINFADMLAGKTSLQEIIDEHIGFMAKKYQMLHVDYEFGVIGGKAAGYSKKNIELFRKTYAISADERLTPAILAGKFRELWTEFRCAQNGEMLKFIRAGIKKANPACDFGAYSAYQAKGLKRGHYGVDWRSFGKHLDIVMCGYGRGHYADTREAIGPDKPFVGGEGVWEKDYDSKKSEVRLFQRAVDSGSFMLYYDGVDDGRFYAAASKVIGAAADFEKIFRRNRRADDLVEIENPKEVAKGDVAVLMAENGERLVFLMNSSDKPKEFVIKNKNLTKNTHAIEYFDKQTFSDPESIACSVPANKVKMIYLCFDDGKTPKAPMPISPNLKHPPSNQFPIFRWRDDGRVHSYNVECAMIRKGISHVVYCGGSRSRMSQTRVLKAGKYKWRVRAMSELTRKSGDWSAWTEFTVPKVHNIEIVPTFAAPGAQVTFKGDVMGGNDWSLEIKNGKGETVKTLKGNGYLAQAAWAPPVKAATLEGEEYFAIFSSGGIAGAPVRFFANSAKGLHNTSIEALGKWCSMLWDGGECRDGVEYACRDYGTTRSGTYSLKLRKENAICPFWSSNYRCYPGGSIPVEVMPGEKYEFTAWVKNSNPRVRGGISITCVDENALRLKTTGARLTGKTEWTKITAKMVIPSGGVRLVFGLSVAGGDGTAWFDSFELKKISK
jgi:hypothetical protein